jgi:hypothetical protein
MLSEDDDLIINKIPGCNICDWLLVNRPLHVCKKIQYSKQYTIDDHVYYFMQQYGQNNVRGGTFLNVVLSFKEKKMLQEIMELRQFKLQKEQKKRRFLLCSCFKQFDESIPLLEEIYTL